MVEITGKLLADLLPTGVVRLESVLTSPVVAKSFLIPTHQCLKPIWLKKKTRPRATRLVGLEGNCTTRFTRGEIPMDVFPTQDRIEFSRINRNVDTAKEN